MMDDDDGTGIRRVPAKTIIKKLMLRDPLISIDELDARLREDGHKVSRIAISAVRDHFRDALKLLMQEGLIKDGSGKQRLIKAGFKRKLVYGYREKPRDDLSPPGGKKKKRWKPWHFHG
jgi:hypothetical protein